MTPRIVPSRCFPSAFAPHRRGRAALITVAGWLATGCAPDPGPPPTGDGDASEGSSDGADESSEGSGDDADETSSEDAAMGDCGNAVVDEGELCDDGVNDGSYGGCEPGCGALAPHCGDATVQRDAGEVCDDGVNDGTYDGCAADCTALGPHCGDGVVDRDADEACDGGAEPDGIACNVNCDVPGTLLWEDVRDGVTFGNVDSEEIVAVLPQAEGGVVVAGRDGITDPSGFVLYARRYDSQGAVLWTETYALTEASLYPSDGTIAPDGAMWIAGTTFEDEFIASLTADGAYEVDLDQDLGLWQWTTIDADPVDGWIALGEGVGVAVLQKRIGGGEAWTVTIGDTETWSDVAIDPTGNVFVCGAAEAFGGSSVLRKFTPDGDLEWYRYDLESDRLLAVATTPDGSAAVVAEQAASARVVVYTPDGEVAWTHAAADDRPARIGVDDEGRVVTHGATADSSTTYVRKLAADGTPMWRTELVGGGYVPNGQRIGFDRLDGDIYLGGTAYSDTGVFSGTRATWVARIAG